MYEVRKGRLVGGNRGFWVHRITGPKSSAPLRFFYNEKKAEAHIEKLERGEFGEPEYKVHKGKCPDNTHSYYVISKQQGQATHWLSGPIKDKAKAEAIAKDYAEKGKYEPG